VCTPGLKVKEIRLEAWTGPEGFKTIGTWRWQSCQPYAPAAFITQETFLVLISVRNWVNIRAIVR